MNLTEEQILILAPDESSKKSGRELSNAAKWVTKGANDIALWGECQGSGSKPYQTQVDLANIAFKCSCPSRKFPCKHGLGLLLLYARQKKDFSVAEPPAWVAEWIGKRTDKQEKQAEKKDKPVDAEAQAKRRQAREQKVSEGVEELLLWIKDIIRNGILNMPEKGAAWFESMARRMVDVQAPGLAGMVKGLRDINYYRENWQAEFTDQLIRIYLVISGYKNITSLHEGLQQDILTWIGFTQDQELLKGQAGTSDTWLVLGKQTSEEDNLTVERNWLYGLKSRQYALVMQFFVRGQGVQHLLTPGMYIQAELVYFPSAAPLRAIIKQQLAPDSPSPYKGFEGWQQVMEAETALSAQLPFRNERPYIIERIRMVYHNEQWWLQDRNSKMVRVKDGFRSTWKLLAIGGGQPLDVAVIGKEKMFEPIGVWADNEYKLL